jgi:hypothetical protein
MTKQINFDASLIGQEGITVKTVSGEEIKQLTFFQCDDTYPIYGVVGTECISWKINGYELDEEETSDNDLVMYREVKTMMVDEWTDSVTHFTGNEYMIGWIRGAKDLAAAIKNGEVECGCNGK